MQEIGRIREQWAVLIPRPWWRDIGPKCCRTISRVYPPRVRALSASLSISTPRSLLALDRISTVARFVQTSKSCRFSDRTDEEEIWWKMIISFLLSIEPFYNLFDRTIGKEIFKWSSNSFRFWRHNLFSILVSRYKSHCIYWIVHLFM